MNRIFTPASIALPKFAPEDAEHFSRWAVIACDQFTSDPAYWAQAEKIREGCPSALDLFLPEAYLGTEKEEEQRQKVAEEQEKAEFSVTENAVVYLRRTLPDGRVRRGLIGKLDLEEYDYQKRSAPRVRATEETVLSRIPPRVAIREKAVWELPHVLVLVDDCENIIAGMEKEIPALRLAYKAPLMLGGGAVEGYFVKGEALARLEARLADYEEKREAAGTFSYAVGDGNHSLASAKAHYENLKKTLGEAAKNHPARYALVEITALGDAALDFEPIYRVVKNCDTADLLAALRKATAGEGQKVTVLTAQGAEELTLAPTHALTVGTLQKFLDEYLAAHTEAKIDYIHDEAELKRLAAEKNAVGFLFDGMDKAELFPYVTAHGTCPRKTFSMGEARSKRYYLEARKIK